MTINELNNTIIFEKNMAELATEFTTAKEELKTDIDERITLAKIKTFVEDCRKNFFLKYKTSNFIITKIENEAKKLVLTVDTKITKLESVKEIDMSYIKPMIKYLKAFKKEINTHVTAEKINYNARTTS